MPSFGVMPFRIRLFSRSNLDSHISLYTVSTLHLVAVPGDTEVLHKTLTDIVHDGSLCVCASYFMVEQ